jgi:hypothetical protein
VALPQQKSPAQGASVTISSSTAATGRLIRLSLVPKLLLGNPLGRKAPLRKIIRWEYYPITSEVTTQSLGQNSVSKQELRNEGKKDTLKGVFVALFFIVNVLFAIHHPINSKLRFYDRAQLRGFWCQGIPSNILQKALGFSQ